MLFCVSKSDKKNILILSNKNFVFMIIKILLYSNLLRKLLVTSMVLFGSGKLHIAKAYACIFSTY